MKSIDCDIRKNVALMASVIVLLFFVTLLSSLAIALTIPTAPSAPGVPPSIDPTSYVVIIDSPISGSTVNATSNVTFHHTAPTALQCTLLTNGSSAIAPVSVTTSKELRLRFSNGTSWIVATCSNGTLGPLYSANITIIVNNGITPKPEPDPVFESTLITILSPTEPVKPTFNVTYKQTTGATLSCTAKVGTITRANASTPTNVVTTARYTNMGAKNYTVNVTCSNATWTGFRLRNITVDNTTFGGLSIKPLAVYAGDSVKINGSLSEQSDIEIEVVSPTGSKNTTTITSKDTGAFLYTYTVSMTARSGVYRVTATDTLDDTTKNGTFTVLSRVPTLSVVGNATQGKNVTIVGTNFLRNDNTSLTLTGTANGNVVSYVITDDAGSFEYVFEDLSAKRYVLIAKSVEFPSNTATLSFNVSLPKILPTTPPDTVPDVPPIDTPGTNGNGGSVPLGPDPTQTQGSGQSVNTLPESSVEQPSSVKDPTNTQDGVAPTSGGMSWWLIILMAVVVFGALVGYLAYNGTLDFSSVDALKESIGNVFSGNMSSNHNTGFAPNVVGQAGNSFGSTGNVYHDNATVSSNNVELRSFIDGERSRGFDDLTIRGALIAKGWEKADVDKTFEEIYTQQSKPQ